MILLMHTLPFFSMELRIPNRKRSFIFSALFLLLPLVITKAQSGILNDYIQEGLGSNLALQQKFDSYRQSIEELHEARGMFFPALSINARMTVAEGGRMIDFPVGDLLNPVYSTLNMLTSSNQFPEISNVEFPFLRPFEHETKLQVVQPLFNPQIYYNHKIKTDLSLASKADAKMYKRYLVCEIKTAYFSYLKAVQVHRLIDNTRLLLEENVRVNESLYANNKVTIDNIYRSKVELSKLEKKKAEALKISNSAAAYFNFLLNRPLNAEIVPDSGIVIRKPDYTIAELGKTALEFREDLTMMKYYTSAASNNFRLSRSVKVPTLLGVLDYGFQGDKYSFTGADDFAMASLVLRWDLFTGMQNEAKIKKAMIGKEMAEKKFRELESAIRLEVANAWYALGAAGKSIDASELEVESANKAYYIVEKKYKQGQANMIEYIDARTSKTNAGENLIIVRYDYMIRIAEYEKAAGLYVFGSLK